MKKVVGFLSRAHGFNVFKALVESSNYEILKIYTHKLNPKSQDPSRSVRSDYELFMKKCKEKNIEFDSIDSKNDQIKDCPDCDYIVEVSWRYLIPESITSKAKIIAFGIHRGKLPEYAGAQPIKQALEHGDKKIILSAHELKNIIDEGNVIATIQHQVNYNEKLSLDENIQRLRNEITPHFSKLLFNTFEKLEQKV